MSRCMAFSIAGERRSSIYGLIIAAGAGVDDMKNFIATAWGLQR